MEHLGGLFSGFAVILLLTCFVKLATTLTIFRYAIGLTQASFGVVTLALSLALTLFVVESQFRDLGGLNAILRGEYTKDVNLEERFTPFLEKHGDQALRDKFTSMAKNSSKVAVPVGQSSSKEVDIKDKQPANLERNETKLFGPTLAAFLVSQLREAFQLGLIILIPFLVIDLLIANALALLGITQISADIVSLPLKLLLFVAVDGWGLISEKLIRVYFQT